MLRLGPLLPPARLPEFLDGYEAWAQAHRIGYTSIAFTGEIDPQAAASRGWACERHANAVVDLRGGAKAAYGRLSAECRRRIRRARRLGLKIIESDLSPHIDRYVALSAEIFARSNLKTRLTPAVLADMLETLRRAGCLVSLLAEVDGQVAAMYIAAWYRKTVCGLDTVSDPRLRPSPINNLMQWHAMEWACANGFEAIDLGGARIKSLARFKTSFGATILGYSNITKAHNLPARAAAWLMRKAARRRRDAKRRDGRRTEPHKRNP